MGITKNIQTKENLIIMAKAAFPTKKIAECKELTEGMCNVTYYIEFNDGSESILKVSAEDNSGFMSHEVNMMYAEVETMKLLKENNIPYVAEVQYYDNSRSICTGEFFFMEVLEGENLFSLTERLTEEEQANINFAIGEYQRKLLDITNETFGVFGDFENKFTNFYDFIVHSITNAVNNSVLKNIDLGVNDSEILALLSLDNGCFEEVKIPTLVHYDMWSGNIFIKDGKLNGVIDWERTLWGDYLMEDRFRRHTRAKSFLEGFGKNEFTKNEYRRILWYDVLLYIIMMTEGAYRGYENDSQYQWCKPIFLETWKEIINDTRLAVN